MQANHSGRTPGRRSFVYRYGGALTMVAALTLGYSGVRAQDKQTAPQAGVSGAAQNTASVPAELRALAKQATAAVNAHDVKALAPLTEAADPAQAFGWLKGGAGPVTRTGGKVWQGDILTVPNKGKEDSSLLPPPSFLFVLHAWHSCESDGDHVYLLTKNGTNWKIGSEIPETETTGLRVRDHRLNVSFDIPKKTARIQDDAAIETVGGSDSPVTFLRLSQDFKVSQAQVERDGKREPLPFAQVGGILALTPPTGKFTLHLAYEGMVNHQGSDYIRSNEATLNSYWYPHTARLPATSTVTVNTPAGWTALAQGEKTGATENADGSRAVTYRNDVPNCFFTVDMGKYTVTSRLVKGRTLSAYLLTPNPALAKASLDTLARALDFYDKNFAPFPYTRYGVVETEGPFGGALEAYSFATFQKGTLPFVIPHELAHTWWGGLVPCPYTRSMWNESFAEYSDSLFQRSEKKAAGATVIALPRDRSRLVGFFDAFSMTQAHDTDDGRQAAIGYGKGALVLRVLEEEVGQETMLRAVRQFASSHTRGEAAEWPEFEQALDKTTGQDYHWFFAQWMERVGLPKLRLAGVHAQHGADGYTIEGDIVQEGTPYRIAMPVRLERLDGPPVAATVRVDGATTHFTLKAASAPVRLRLDPNNVIPFTPASDTPDKQSPDTFDFPK